MPDGAGSPCEPSFMRHTTSLALPPAALVDLPAVALAHIAVQLERPQDRVALAAACRALRALSDGWWGDIQLALESDEQALRLGAWLANERPLVRALHVDGSRCPQLTWGVDLPTPPLPALVGLSLASQPLDPLHQLPAVLAHTQLTGLALRGCGLAAVPAALAEVCGLRSLELSRNPLAAGLEHLSSLQQLTALGLAACALSELPAAVNCLGALRSLHLRWNRRLRGGLQHLEGANQLTALDLRQCDVAALPPAMSNLIKLQRLGLSGNCQLALGISHLAGLGQLTSLYISSCALGGLPDTFSTLTALQRLDLSGNRQLSGGLEHLRGLAQLSSLRLGGCSIRAVPPAFSTLHSLEKLELNGNPQLDAHSLRHLQQLPRLACVDLRQCSLGAQRLATLDAHPANVRF